MFSRLTKLDPTGLADKVVDTAVGTVSSVADTGTKLLNGAVQGAKIEIGGAEIEIDTAAAATMLYNAIVPQTAQAVLAGRLPDKQDFVDDAVAYVGGPLAGIYVAANSPSALLIANGHTPPAEMLGKDMVAALTPVAKKKLGL